MRDTMPGELTIWDAATGQEVRDLRGQLGEIRSVAWSPDGKRLASAGGAETAIVAPGSAKIWDAATGKELCDLKGNPGPVQSISWSPDGLQVATTSFDNDRQAPGGVVKVWNAATGGESRRLHVGPREVYSALWSPGGKYFASLGIDGATVWDPATWKEVQTIPGVGNRVADSLAWRDDSHVAFMNRGDGVVTVRAIGPAVSSSAVTGITP